MFIPEPLTFDLHYTCHSEHCFLLLFLLCFIFSFSFLTRPHLNPLLLPLSLFSVTNSSQLKYSFSPSCSLILLFLFLSLCLPPRPPAPLTLSFLPSVINLSLSEELKPKEFGQSFTFSHGVINLPLCLPSPPSSVPSLPRLPLTSRGVCVFVWPGCETQILCNDRTHTEVNTRK